MSKIMNKIKKQNFFIIGTLFIFIYLSNIFLINHNCSKFINYDMNFELNKKIDNIFNLSFEDKIELSEEIMIFSSKCDNNKPFIKIIEKRGDKIIEDYYSETDKYKLNNLTKNFTTHYALYYLYHSKYGSESMSNISEEKMHEYLPMISENINIPLNYD